MSNDDRETMFETEKSKVQLDREGTIYISGSEETVLSDFDLKNITRVSKALKKEKEGK